MKNQKNVKKGNREGKTFKSVEIRINKIYLKNVEEAPGVR